MCQSIRAEQVTLLLVDKEWISTTYHTALQGVQWRFIGVSQRLLASTYEPYLAFEFAV